MVASEAVGVRNFPDLAAAGEDHLRSAPLSQSLILIYIHICIYIFIYIYVYRYICIYMYIYL